MMGYMFRIDVRDITKGGLDMPTIKAPLMRLIFRYFIEIFMVKSMVIATNSSVGLKTTL